VKAVRTTLTLVIVAIFAITGIMLAGAARSVPGNAARPAASSPFTVNGCPEGAGWDGTC
jgi:hypothetical protein